MRKLEDWIEYMEGEGDLLQMGQLGLLLKHSLADQVVLDNLRRLRRRIELADPADQVDQEISRSDFLGEFHAQTMLKITQVKGVRRQRRGSSLSPDAGSKSSLGSCKT